MTRQRHVEIAGAGFAGLTAAIALKARGWSVRVHEASSELRAFGAGIYIWENGLRVLRAIGAYDAAVAGAFDSGIMESRFEGRSRAIQHFGPEVGSRMLCMTRQHLYDAIIDAARRADVEILVNSEVIGAAPEGLLRTASGGSFGADLIIGADGVGSQVRDALGLHMEREIYADGVIRLLVPRAPNELADDEWNRVVDFWTLSPRPRRILYTPCNTEELYLCMMAPHDDPEAAAIPVRKDEWTKAFPYMADILGRIGTGGRYDRYQMIRLDKWSRGRVAVVGDAAHSMPPTLGQGAGCAMMNALGLAVALEDAASVEEGLAKWEALERPLTDHTQALAVALAKTRSLADGHSWDQEALRAARHVPTGTVATLGQ